MKRDLTESSFKMRMESKGWPWVEGPSCLWGISTPLLLDVVVGKVGLWVDGGGRMANGRWWRWHLPHDLRVQDSMSRSLCCSSEQFNKWEGVVCNHSRMQKLSPHISWSPRTFSPWLTCRATWQDPAFSLISVGYGNLHHAPKSGVLGFFLLLPLL